MVTGWRFLALSGTLFALVVAVVRGVLALVDRRAKSTHPFVSEQWLAEHHVSPPRDWPA